MIEKGILLVEDNEDDIKLMTKALVDNHVVNWIELARDGAQAVDMLLGKGNYQGKALAGKVAVVLLDIKLPKLSGLEVLKLIRANETTRFLPVVILTSSKQDRDIIDSYQNGCNSYVCKPVESVEFCNAVRDIGLYWLLCNQHPIKE